VLWGPSRHLETLTAANWVSFDFNVPYSSCWGYSLINTLKLKKNWSEKTAWQKWRVQESSPRRGAARRCLRWANAPCLGLRVLWLGHTQQCHATSRKPCTWKLRLLKNGRRSSEGALPSRSSHGRLNAKLPIYKQRPFSWPAARTRVLACFSRILEPDLLVFKCLPDRAIRQVRSCSSSWRRRTSDSTRPRQQHDRCLCPGAWTACGMQREYLPPVPFVGFC